MSRPTHMNHERTPSQIGIQLTQLRRDITDAQISEIKRYQDFSTIDWIDQTAHENNKRLESHAHPKRWFQLYSAAQGWVVLALVGVAIGLTAAFLSIITEWTSDLKNGYCKPAFYLNEDFCCSGYDGKCPEWVSWTSFGPLNYIMYIVISVLFASSAAILVAAFAPYAAGSGISEIKCIISGFIMKGFLGLKTLGIKCIALPLSIASGMSVGKEGPSVHYAACVGNVIASQFSRFRGHNSKMREVLCSCTAAGVAVAFGSPMGGVLFALEEMSSSFSIKTMWRSYFCALVATGTLAAANPFRTGQLVLFSVKYDHNWHYFELIFFVIIGLFGGFAGLFIIKWNLRVQAFRKKYLANHAILEAVVLILITSSICYFNRFLRVDMTESMGILFHECGADWDHVTCDPSRRTSIAFSLLMALLIRGFLTIISYGCKVPAGIFVPSLAIGALFGRLVGTLAWALYDRHPDLFLFARCDPNGACITPGTYALLGSAALLSGVMNITVTVVIIIFEITGALTYILPTMIVVGVTKAVCDKWGHGGIADRTIVANGYPFIDSDHLEQPDSAISETVAAAMTSMLNKVQENMTVYEISQLLDDTTKKHESYPVVNTHHIFLGYVWRAALEDLVNRKLQNDSQVKCQFSESGANRASDDCIDCSRLVNSNCVLVTQTMSIARVVDVFSKAGPRLIYVTNNGVLLGLVTQKDIMKYHYKTEYALSPRDTSAVEEFDRKLWEWILGSAQRVNSTRVSDISSNINRLTSLFPWRRSSSAFIPGRTGN